MGDLGERLSQARRKKGLSLEEAAAATKIKMEYLRALEAEEYAALPSPAYARGFLKIYAHLLGLDYGSLNQLYERVSGSPEPQVIFAPQRKVRSVPFLPAVKWTRLLQVLGLAALLILLGIGVFNLFRGRQRVLETSGKFSEIDDPYTPETLEKIALSDELAFSESSGKAALKLEARAGEEVWLEVRADSALVFYGLLRPGSPVRWKAGGDYKVRVGNAAKVRLLLNGEEIKFPDPTASDVHFTIDREGVRFEK